MHSRAAAWKFDLSLRDGRREYWTGVRAAQLGVALTDWSLVGPDYRLGVHHVRAGIIRRDPLALVHDGPGFIADPADVPVPGQPRIRHDVAWDWPAR